MAELCLDCWNKIYEMNDTKKKFLISRGYDLCEECGEYKPVIIRMRMWYLYKELVSEWIEDMKTVRSSKKKTP